MDTSKTRRSDFMDNKVVSPPPPPSPPMDTSPGHASPLASPSTARSPFSWGHRVSEVTEVPHYAAAVGSPPGETEPRGHCEHGHGPADLCNVSPKNVTCSTSGEDHSERKGGELRHQTMEVIPGRTTHKVVCRWKTCGQLFPGQRQLSTHVNDDHVRIERPDLDFHCHWQGCPRLGKGFNARYKMLIHIRTHTNEKPHSCPMCSKCFSRLENLKIHTRSHTGEKPYLCTFPGCGKAYSNSSDRFKHVRTHQEEKPYKCKMPGCQKQYTDPSSLRKHVRTYGHSFGLDGAVSRRASGAKDCGVLGIRSVRVDVSSHRDLCSKYHSGVNTHVPPRTPEALSGNNSLQDEAKRCKLSAFEYPSGNVHGKGESFGLNRNMRTNANGDNEDSHLNNIFLSLCKQELPSGDDRESRAANTCPYPGKVLDFQMRCRENHGGKIHHGTGSDVKMHTMPDVNNNVCKTEEETETSVRSSARIYDSEVLSHAVRSHTKSPGLEYKSPLNRTVPSEGEKLSLVSTSDVSNAGHLPAVSLTSTRHWKKRKILCSESEQKVVALTASAPIESHRPWQQSPHTPTQMEQQSPHPPTQSPHPPTQSPHPPTQSPPRPTQSPELTPQIPTLPPGILCRPQASSTPLSPLTARPWSPDLERNVYTLAQQKSQSSHTGSPLSSFTHSPLSSYTHSPLSSYSTDSPPLEFLNSSKYCRNAFSPPCFKNPPLMTPSNPNTAKCDLPTANCPMYPLLQLPYSDQHPFICSPSSVSSCPNVSLPLMFPLRPQSHRPASASDYLGGHGLHRYTPSTGPFLCDGKLHDSAPARYLVSLTPILDMPPALSPLMELLYPVHLSHYHHQYY
ncbi:unnamed protein product [Lymnaea stagnalis]|uniref:C2H2-type domain-containing protein n=1 Tax=Lymnaea stagnalis TaxID=6523 RepID=A0AAV2IBY3_LYMST